MQEPTRSALHPVIQHDTETIASPPIEPLASAGEVPLVELVRPGLGVLPADLKQAKPNSGSPHGMIVEANVPDDSPAGPAASACKNEREEDRQDDNSRGYDGEPDRMPRGPSRTLSKADKRAHHRSSS